MKKNIKPIINKDVEDRIEIRSPLSIYAFRVNTKPSYMKVGDTFRPVEIRIKEWNEKLKHNIGDHLVLTQEGSWKAMLDNDKVYFRDYALHYVFDNLWHKNRLPENEQKQYSKEFFEDINKQDVAKAIKIVKDAYKDDNNSSLFDYYQICDRRSIDFQFKRNANWELRDNQKKVVDNFCDKVKKGKNKLLMYAVMRFGKSFTAISCALAMKYTKVLIVSAKADVAGEWKKTVEKPLCFDGFKFLVDNDFIENKDAIETEIEKGSKCVVTFLTLQNITGGDGIKDDRTRDKQRDRPR